jgi:hypothetical protein
MNLLISITALAATGVVPLQGVMYGADSQPLEGTHTLTFHLSGQNPSEAAAPLLDDPQQVLFVNGSFAAALGTTSPLDLDHFANYQTLTLTVQVDGGAPSAPVHITWTPRAAYALRAGAAALADLATSALSADHASSADNASSADHASSADEATTALVADALANPYSAGAGLYLSGSGEFSIDYGSLDAYTRSEVDTLLGAVSSSATGAAGNGSAPPGSGAGAFDTPGQNCRSILDANPASASGTYWVTDGGETPFKVWCDMTTGGGGWTLALQTSGASAYTYSHAVWSATSAPFTNVTSALADQDMASPAFYLESGDESMICFGDMGHCASWDHAFGTPRALANGAALSGTPAGASSCVTLKCPPASMPRALNTAIPPTTASAWHRFGYLNQTNAHGTKIRVGFSADVDASDSLDTIAGAGLECAGTCLSTNVTGGPHNTGSGYYKYNSVSTAPHSGTMPVYLFIRARGASASYGTQANPATSCKALLSARPSLLNQSGAYWLRLPSGGAYEAYCEMSAAKGGGGWTLVMTASSASAYVRSHAVWSDMGAPAGPAPTPSVDADRVSPAFYNLSGTESMLCMGPATLTNCASWTHPSNANNTARYFVNQSGPSATQGSAGACTTFACGANTRPTALNSVNGVGTNAGAWHRFGYINGTNGWGANVRVGFAGDNDSSDSSDTVFGIGLECTVNCPGTNLTGPAHGTGSGWYFHSAWAAGAPFDGANRGYLFVR